MGACTHTHTQTHTEQATHIDTDSLHTGPSYQDGQSTGAYGVEERIGDLDLFSLKKKRIRAFLLLSVLLYNCKLMIEGVERSQTLLRRVQQKDERDREKLNMGYSQFKSRENVFHHGGDQTLE